MTSSNSNQYLIRTAFEKFYPAWLEQHPDTPLHVRRTAESIMKCKTGRLGYNVSVCAKCGRPVIHAVSCNNRSCPCCQAALTKKWEMERSCELIPGIAYYHVVFTMPHELNPLVKANASLLLSLLFECAQNTLLSLCADPRFLGAKPGIVSVLHTWGQKLSFHPHIHVCISGGGITPAGRFVEAAHKGFFLPVGALAAGLRGRYLTRLKELYDSSLLNLSCCKSLRSPAEWKRFIDMLFDKPWLPFVKETFNGKGNAVQYLARYSYRTAISNSRIVSVDGDTVSFRYKDYADANREKVMTVSGTAFISLFLQHVLPAGFHRVRFCGYLTNAAKSKNLKLIHLLRWSVYMGNPYRDMNTAQLLMALYHRDICVCASCSGKMISYPRGMPLSMITSLLSAAPSAMC